ncbi:hypothetical protein ACN27F_10305 [Solwaraspora sp. WMMB335]|uniref:hypothetical protein n=1 Tax=Solwaraspora sp. WMMB335 TaxID=3404118 RepID=UPI003B955207
MSTVDERIALDRPLSLFEHATRLHEQHPNAPLPRGGRPYPDDRAGRCPERRAKTAERVAALMSVLEAFLSDPSASVQVLHDALSRLDLFGRAVESTVDKLPTLGAERARETGAWLVRHATDRRPAMVGLALLAGTGRTDDAPLIRTIGLLDYFGPLAVTALTALPSATPNLIWLAERSQRWARIKAIEALCQRDDPDAVAWLRRHAVNDEEMSASLARQVAEAVSLADALDAPNVDDRVLDQAGQLLLAMVTPNDYRTQLVDYGDARRAYHTLAQRLADVPASMQRYAMLASLIEDLRTGFAACLDWNPGQREETVANLRTTLLRHDWSGHLATALQSTDPLTRQRADWARRRVADAVRPANDPPAPQPFQINVVAPDPLRRDDVQTRILVNGRPVVAAAFDKGPPYPPETLLTRGHLRAAEEPHEARLAEAYCTEGCCGALYVTIARDGDTVIWRDWRGHTSAAVPPEMRFSAEQYDAELIRAETDYTWEWPARTTARLLRARLDAQPDLLTRWECQPGWIWARANEPDQVRFSFTYPERPKFTDDTPWLQFERIITVDDTPAIEQADRLAQQLETIDPKTKATVVGGRRDYAEQLGYPWPEPQR